jgi:hypothetical protein
MTTAFGCDLKLRSGGLSFTTGVGVAIGEQRPLVQLVMIGFSVATGAIGTKIGSVLQKSRLCSARKAFLAHRWA